MLKPRSKGRAKIGWKKYGNTWYPVYEKKKSFKHDIFNRSSSTIRVRIKK